MGLFKDMKNMKDTAAEHGGMPSFKDARKDMRAVFDDRGERDILKNGISAMAICKGMTMPVQGDRFAMQVPIEVHPPEGDPYEVNYVFTASRMQTGLTPGMQLPIKISPTDPTKVAVQWDAQKAEVAAAGGSLAATMQGMANMTPEQMQAMNANAMASQGVTKMPDFMTGATAAAAAQEGPKERIAKLDELKASGIIDDAEYEKKKQEIIDSI